jgi:rSAM/selenodomain-associated transferase 1
VVCRGPTHRDREAVPLKDTVIVFARAPRLGAVKRRLARGIGARAALRFYTGTLRRLLRALAADRRFRTIIAVVGPGAPIRARGLSQIAQTRGDLGQRMHRAFARFPRGRVALVGSDIPDVTPADLVSAFAALGSADAAFGPALDGGYWLVAMGSRRPARPFVHVRWSTEHARADTLRNFTGYRIALLRTLRDIDTAEDFYAWQT